MTVLVVLAVVPAGLRLLVQVLCAVVHRRRRRGPLEHLGPVSVIVPAHQQAATVAGTVRSLVASDYPGIEVIVVDDGSTDGTADIVERLGLPGVFVLRQPTAGRAAALRNGIGYACADIVVLVDGDTVVAPDAVGRLVQPLLDPRVGAVSGNTRVAGREGRLGRWQHLEYVTGLGLDRRVSDVARCLPTVPGGAVTAFRRTAILAADGSAPALAEDTDLTMAVIRSGRRVAHAPTAVAWTEVPATLGQLWRERGQWHYDTLRAVWRLRRGAGLRGLAYLLLFQVLLPLTAPLVDACAVYGLFVGPPAAVAAVWAGFTAAHLATAAYALHLDGERFGSLWSLPLQQVVHRQLMCLVVIRSTVLALLHGRPGAPPPGRGDPVARRDGGSPAATFPAMDRRPG
jgi:glycosyltransferase involved in cell wall biosynthesis